MQALILAAGLGTRLRPLTNNRPKALIEICGKKLLEINLEHIANNGASPCVINIHHFGDLVMNFVKERSSSANLPPVIISDEREMLLDTGGAIRHAAPLLSASEPILVHNVDVLSDVDFHALEKQHLASGNLVTLCVCRRDSRRKLLFDSTGNLCGRLEEGIPDGCQAFAFSGIAMISPKLPYMLPPDDHPYPVVDEYIRLAKEHRIGYYLHDANHWIDLGTIEHLETANRLFTPETLNTFINTGLMPSISNPA